MSEETKKIDGKDLETVQMSVPTTKASKKIPIYIYFIVVLVIIVVAGYFYFRGKIDNGEYHSPQIRQMQKMVTKVRGLESDIQNKQNEIFSMMKEYKEKTGEELPPVNLLNLSEEEKEVLEEKIKNEEDVSIKSMLNDIMDKNTEIDDMQEEINRLEKLLPTAHVVQQGESHYQLAMDFLLNEKGVDKKEALKLIERSLLFEPLIPGFKVWNFYSGKEYGTFITQGSAAISPNQVRRKAKKKLVDARDNAISERDKLSLDIEALESRREQVIYQLELLNREKENLIAQVSDLHKENQKMQETINSVHYLVGKKKDLKKQQILKGGFLKSLKLSDVSPDDFSNSIDLRAGYTIPINAIDYNLKKIKKVTLFPRFFKKRKDFEITYSKDRQLVEITIIDIDKMKNERIVISIE